MCHQVHEDTDIVVAISYQLQGSAYPPPNCGRQVEIEITEIGEGGGDFEKGKRILATVVDTCMNCGLADMELSVGAYQALTGGNLDPNGSFFIDWRFVVDADLVEYRGL